MQGPLPGLARAAVLLGAVATALPAWAHHPMGGAAPQGALEGLLSGLAHPLLGADHALLLAALGLASHFQKRVLQPAAAWVVAAAIGAALCSLLGPVPGIELAVAATLVGAAALVLTQPAIGAASLAALAAAAGLVHGHALGEAIVGSDRSVALSYLAGLALVQLGLVATVAGMATRLSPRLQRVAARAVGLACLVGAVGLGATA